MKILENTFTQADSDVLVDTAQAKIEQIKLSEDLSMSTITIHGMQEYTFTTRSGILTTQVGMGTIFTNNDQTDLNLFNKVALSRGERVTINNPQAIPLILNFISTNWLTDHSGRVIIVTYTSRVTHMSNYIIVDTFNLFFRAKHAAGRAKDIDLKVGMALNIMFNSVKKMYNEFDGTHVVFCLEGRSWRKDFYTPYKANRKVTAAKRSAREVEDDEIFFESYDHLITFLRDKSNCTVIQHPELEADDLIAGWIQAHPDDNHTIISTDSDFYQLIASNVKQYNGVTDTIINTEGFFDIKGKAKIDNKTKDIKPAPEPEWILFEKCVRGDSADNVFSAYPGARLKGTKNKTGIREAYDDRNTGGYDYNNFMLQRWVDHEEAEHRVKDDYERNRTLIDLTAQPEDIRVKMFETVASATDPEAVSQVGIHFLKFCSTWNLPRIAEYPDDFARFLNAKYK